jgi:PleD family two-component response regulator
MRNEDITPRYEICWSAVDGWWVRVAFHNPTSYIHNREKTFKNCDSPERAFALANEWVKENLSPGPTTIQTGTGMAGSGGKMVLLVDDDPSVLRLLSGGLSQQGYDVHVAPHPVQALELAKAATPCFDLVVSDVIMPEMCGPELVRNIRRRALFRL